jgi:hypothetical protein
MLNQFEACITFRIIKAIFSWEMNGNTAACNTSPWKPKTVRSRVTRTRHMSRHDKGNNSMTSLLFASRYSECSKVVIRKCFDVNISEINAFTVSILGRCLFSSLNWNHLSRCEGHRINMNCLRSSLLHLPTEAWQYKSTRDKEFTFLFAGLWDRAV